MTEPKSQLPASQIAETERLSIGTGSVGSFSGRASFGVRSGGLVATVAPQAPQQLAPDWATEGGELAMPMLRAAVHVLRLGVRAHRSSAEYEVAKRLFDLEPSTISHQNVHQSSRAAVEAQARFAEAIELYERDLGPIT